MHYQKYLQNPKKILKIKNHFLVGMLMIKNWLGQKELDSFQIKIVLLKVRT
jgi:hypothetical protein